ncbi:MAG: hypothetical protein HY714_00900 [Candidatus Omnitrophica bacterium]|nr:hypothetical protein [Candidatus Omnitrophota bacterium]
MKLTRESGFTLLEGMVSTFLMSIVVLLTIQAFHSGSRIHDVTYNQSRLSGEARMAMERMTRELRNSNLARVLVPQAGLLQFQVPAAIDANGNITWSGWLQYSLGGQDGEQLMRQDITTGATEVLANKVTNLQFAVNANPATLTITMTSQDATDYGITTPISLSGTVDFRN